MCLRRHICTDICDKVSSPRTPRPHQLALVPVKLEGWLEPPTTSQSRKDLLTRL